MRQGREIGWWLRILVPPLAVLAFSLAASWLVAGQVRDRERERITRGADEVVDEVQQRMEAYADVLYGVKGLFEATGRVSRAEFHDYVGAQDVAHRYPGVQVSGFAALVPVREQRRYVRDVRRDVVASGLPYPRFAPFPAPAGPDRLLISYLEPQRGNERAFGLDFLAERNRRGAAQRALQTNRPTITAPVRLVQERGTQTGFLLYVPVRRADAGVSGVAYAAFRMGDLMRGTLRATGARVSVYDLGPESVAAPAALDSAPPTFASADAPAAGSSHTEVFSVMGRRWAIVYTPTSSVLSGAERTLPWLILLGGATLAVLAFWLLRTAATTERRALALAERMTEDLRTSQAELARSNADLERFAHVASHDLREPLRTVISFLGLLTRRHGDALTPEARGFVDHAAGGAKRMNALIGDLLEYSRIGRSRRPSEPVDLDEVLEVARGNLRAAIEEAGAEVTAGPLPTVAGDPSELAQVLQNLLGNALKYRGERPPRIRIDARRRGEAWEVAVRDNGIGIEPRHHERIFVPFQRLHGREEYEGTGMGLAIVKRVLEARGGNIRLESAPGEGSCFVLTLPAVAPAPEREPALSR